MKLSLQTLFTTALAFLVISTGMLHADDQPPSPPVVHSLEHKTNLGAALDQPDVIVTKNQQEFGNMLGKTHQLARGMYPIKRRYALYINGISVNTSDPKGISAAGIEVKEAVTISGGNFRQTDVDSRYVDAPDISKFQFFVNAMEIEAEKSPQDGDNSEGTYTTPGGTTLIYQHNGKRETDFSLQNESQDVWIFRFSSSKDIAKFKQAVDTAAVWAANQHPPAS